MGIADIIPGISGGTIALITGIYERLIHSISKIDFKFVAYLLKGDWGEAKEKISKIDFKLFIPLISGIGLAMLFMSNIIYFLLKNVTALTYAFFFGLIAASAVLLYKKEHFMSVNNISLSIIGFVFAFLFTGFSALQIGHSLPVLFVSGAMALCAMILPGISGAFILLLLNQYEHMLFVLKNLQFLEIFTFCFGGLAGVLCFSRILDYALKKYEAAVMSFLIGLMLGVLRLPYQNIVSTMDSVLPVLISAMFGFFIVFIPEKIFRKPVNAPDMSKQPPLEN